MDIVDAMNRLSERNAKLRAALEIVRQENNRAKREFTNVSNKIIEDACSVLDSQ